MSDIIAIYGIGPFDMATKLIESNESSAPLSKESSSESIGVGICTKRLKHSLKKCPPKTIEMVRFPKNLQ